MSHGRAPEGDLYSLASQHHAAGRHEQAEQTLRSLLAYEPQHAAGWHLLGAIAFHTRRPAVALEALQKAVAIEPGSALYQTTLAAAYQTLGKTADASACVRKALELRPTDPHVLNHLGIVLASQGKHADALPIFGRAVQLAPDAPEILNNYGAALSVAGKSDAARVHIERALALKPGFAQAHNNLGDALRASGRLEEAIASYQRAVQHWPRYAQAYMNLGMALRETGKLDASVHALQQALQIQPNSAETLTELAFTLFRKNARADAATVYRQALNLKPDFPPALNGLGNVLRVQGVLDEAEAVYRKAVELRPDFMPAVYHLALTLQAQGRLAEAQEIHRRVLAAQPDNAGAHGAYLGSLVYDPRVSAAELLAEHQRWAERHARANRQEVAHANQPDPERPLRVGYVSADFRLHPVAAFLEPILYHHDPARVQCYCYTDVAAADWETAYLASLTANWRVICGMPDSRLAEMIRQDGIDILVDLSGHSAANRLPMFAHKPAPVQVTYLGCPATTGVPAIDYRVVDAITDPPGEPSGATEGLVRLDPVFCCFAPPRNAARPGPLPAKRNGFVTFGSLNKLDKLNADVVALWARILREAAGTRLLLARHTLVGATAERFLKQFEEHGVDRERVACRRADQRQMHHLPIYDEIDVLLDPFPWNGHTTACEALWMGVPVIALRGGRHSARMVASVLNAVGLPEYCASTADDYVRIAVGLSKSIAGLAEVRKHLRGRVLDSPLCDGAGFTRKLEDAYRQMWQRWCAGRKSDTPSGWLA